MMEPKWIIKEAEAQQDKMLTILDTAQDRYSY